MAQIKYAGGSDPLRNKHQGFTFIRSNYGRSMLGNLNNSFSRKPNQRFPMACNQKAVKGWRSISSTLQNLWNTYAITNPQPTIKNPLIFLTGYQLFIKINTYKFLTDGIDADFILDPGVFTTVNDPCSYSVSLVAGRLMLNYSFTNNLSNLKVLVYLSNVVSASIRYASSRPRYMGFIENSPTLSVSFGSLYNHFSVIDPRNFAPVGWHVPTTAEFYTLRNNLGGSTIAGGHLKDTNLDYWLEPNVGANNSSGFSGRGAGRRTPTGSFAAFKSWNEIHSTGVGSGQGVALLLLNYSAAASIGLYDQVAGKSARVLKDDNVLAPCIGNDGFEYPSVKIGDQVWQALPSVETKYRNGDTIPHVTGDSEWGSLSTGAFCYPDNNINLAFSEGDSSLDITDSFINVFGKLPKIGDNLILRTLPIAKDNAMFFDKEIFYLTVD